jgi:carboxyl-terminal processing protease
MNYYLNLMKSRTMHSFIRHSGIRILFYLTFAATLLSCDDDSPSDGTFFLINRDNEYVNTWIEENMKFWYFWNEQLPANVSKKQLPDQYFSALLSSEDRFSWIQNNYQELLNSLNGISKEAGYEYVLYRESSSSENVVAQILYVKPNSPAKAAGLKRGDLITKINGTTITTSNYRDKLKELKENHSLGYKALDIENEQFGEELTISLTTLEYPENPNHLFTVIEQDGRKVGYFVYTFFATGTNNAFDDEMDGIFQEMKNSAITDLVLDLRFNSGGSEVSARNLASLVGADVNSSSVFMKRQYNALVTAEILKSPNLGEAFLTSKFNDEAANIGALLNGKRVYVLTSSRTASASELIINSLRPYMEVFLIGDVTYGKNVGSISLYEDDDPKNKWGLQPIVVKVANSLGTADYGDGFTPNILNKDNSLYIYPLGDLRENLLSVAIEEITGTAPSGGRKGVRAMDTGREVLGHSLDDKRRSFRLVMDENTLPAFDMAQ